MPFLKLTTFATLLLLLVPQARGEDVEFDLSLGRPCPGKSEAQSVCEKAVAGHVGNPNGDYAGCKMTRSGCTEDRFVENQALDAVISEGSTWICRMSCPKPGSVAQGEGFRLSAAKKLEAAKASGGAEGWSAESCNYSRFRGGKTRKVMIAVQGQALRAACGPKSNPEPLLACNTAVDCTFRKGDLEPIRVTKINAICATQATSGKSACPSEEELASCINGQDIRQFGDQVDLVPGELPAPAVSPAPTSGSGA